MTPLEAVLVPIALAVPPLWLMRLERREAIGPGQLYLEPGLVYVTR
jgi:hypothetical protein